MREIHDNFGESWKVFENDWLFNLEFALKVEKDIRNGMPYEASYELNFESDDEEIAIKDVRQNIEYLLKNIEKLPLTLEFWMNSGN